MQQILCDALPANAQAWVFGSRATWKTKRSSDLDLAIDAGRPLTRRESGDLAEAFDESDLPYKVDLVDMHTVSPTFKAIIERDMVRLERNCARYSKYKEYKETGIEWLPQVPAHWEVKRLKYCCDKINPTKKEIRTLPLSTEVSFLPMENIDTKGNFDLSINKPLSEVIDGFTYFKDLDILLAKITPCFENRKGCLVSGLKNSVGFGTTEFHVLRANKSILPEHLYNHIKTNINHKCCPLYEPLRP